MDILWDKLAKLSDRSTVTLRSSLELILKKEVFPLFFPNLYFLYLCFQCCSLIAFISFTYIHNILYLFALYLYNTNSSDIFLPGSQFFNGVMWLLSYLYSAFLLFLIFPSSHWQHQFFRYILARQSIYLLITLLIFFN